MSEIVPPPAPVLSLQEPVPEPPEASGEDAMLCPSCDEPRIGAYCHACGQPFLSERITLRSLARQFAERFLKLERGLIGTFRALFTRPGGVALDYIGGRQRPYVNPLSYLLIGAAASLLILPWVMQGSIGGGDGELPETMQFGIDIAMQINETKLNAMEPEERAAFDELIDRALPIYIEKWGAVMQRLTSVLALALALMLAAFFRLFFGARHTFAENAVGTLYTTGHYYLLTVPLALVLLPLPHGLVLYSIAGGLMLLALVYRLAAGMYGRSWQTTGLAVTSFFGAYIGFTVVVMGLAAFVSLWLAQPEMEAIAEEVFAKHGLR